MSDRDEPALFGQVMFDLALADVVPEAVQGKVAALDGRGDEREGDEVFQADQNGLLFQGGDTLVGVLDLFTRS